MGASFKILSGDVPRQTVVCKPRTRIRGIGAVPLSTNIAELRAITEDNRNVTFEMLVGTGHRFVGVANRSVFSQLSRFAAQSARPAARAKVRKQSTATPVPGCLALLVIGGLVGVVALAVIGSATSTNTSKAVPSFAGERGSGNRATFERATRDAGVVLPAYHIINSERRPPIKASFDIRLEEKIAEEEIEAIARAIHNGETRTYERIFITYYLPGMQVGAGAWATSHWNPDLEVRVLGFTAEEERQALEREASDAADAPRRIGRWVDQTPFVASVIELVELPSGQLEMHQRFKDGSERTVLVSRSGDKYTLERGEYLQIDKAGRLKWYDQEGLIVTCEKAP